MARLFKRTWKRWQSWTVPSKLTVVSAIVTIALIPTVFIDVKPAVSRWLWPPKPRHIPLVSVMIKNSGSTEASLSYRGEFFIWLPGEGAYHIAGTYEIVAADKVPVQPAMVSVPAGGTRTIQARILNEQNLYRYLERQDCELTLFFRRSDGSLFDSGELPFQESDLKKYYARADIAQR